jgi:undecaprenol kinase
MDSNAKKKRKPIPLMKSFSFAINGIRLAIKQERNIRIHLSVSIVVFVAGIAFSISTVQWLFVLFAIGGMIALELMNTAIERLVDLVTLEFHPLAKQAKDLAAGAVFCYAIMSVIIGIIIFGPYILRLF